VSANPAWQRFDPGRNVLILQLHVQPDASHSAIAGLHGERLKVRIAAPAVDAKANALLVDFLGKSFDVAARKVMIVRGTQSRAKTVEIADPTPGLLERIRRFADQ
jgi:uncharacterized protein